MLLLRLKNKNAMAASIAWLVALSLLRRSDSDAYAGGVRHVRRDQAFIAGDVWRGTLTSCHQNSKHLERRWRYFPVEVSIDRADPASGEVVATFVTHADHSFYELKGTYDADARRLFLKPVRGKIGESWEPCDAEAFVSPDFSTMSGVSLCEDHGACDPGGGEFVLRHDRTQFVVEGAGDARVDGEYSSQPRLPVEDGDPRKISVSRNTQLYDGAPVYLQSCPAANPRCDRFAIVHEVIGQFGFWRILPARVLSKPSSGEAQMPSRDGAVYSVCSEDVYPPDNGWRPLQGAGSAPAPSVRATVRSMYADLQNHAVLRAEAPESDPFSRFNSLGLLLCFGALLWALVVVALRAPVKLKDGRKKPAFADQA